MHVTLNCTIDFQDRGESAVLLTQLEEHALHSGLRRIGSRNKGTLLFTTFLSLLLFQTARTFENYKLVE